FSLGLQYGFAGGPGGGGGGFRDFDGEMDSLSYATNGPMPPMAELGDFGGADAPKEEPAERSEPEPEAKETEGGEVAGEDMAERAPGREDVPLFEADQREVGPASGAFDFEEDEKKSRNESLMAFDDKLELSDKRGYLSGWGSFGRPMHGFGGRYRG